MILYYINNYFSELEKKISKEKKNFFISPNQIDKFKLQKIFSKKIELNLENYFISSYIFRYFSYQEYCKVLTIEKIIKSFIKKNKIKKIIFINKFQLNYYQYL